MNELVQNSNPDFLHPVQSDEFLPPISRWATLGGLVLVGTFGAAIALATVTKYNITVKAAATVRPSGELRIVQAATEGVVKTIKVQENQVVKKGDVIAYLDNSRLQIQKSQLAGNIQQSQLQLAQIAAQIKSLNTQVTAESSLMQRNIASAEADLSRNQREYKDRQAITQTEVTEAKAATELAQVQMKQYQKLAFTGAIPSLQIEEKQQSFKAAQARLERAKSALNPSSASVAIATERIAQEKARGESTLAALNKEREDLQSQQIQLQNQLNRDVKELQQIALDISKTSILAPDSGTIFKLEIRNPNQVVRPGAALAQIAPGNAPLVIKARVEPQDIGKIELCQEKDISDCKNGRVQLRFGAYPYPDYGTLKGAVRAIAPDATQPEITKGSTTAAYYEITIEPERPYLVKGKTHYPIQPGMNVTADIISKEQTVLTFLLTKARLLTEL